MMQRQADPQTRQHVLTMELTIASAGAVEAVLVLPSGLSLDSGVSIGVDEGTSVEGLRFRTCLPVGCVIEFALDDALTASMRRGATLQVTATPGDTSQPVSFAVSLIGFAPALDRTATLSK